jgi:hypothetical protein
MIEENQTFCWRGGSSWDAIRRMKVENQSIVSAWRQSNDAAFGIAKTNPL